MRHRAEVAGRHRAAPRPRYGRIAVFGSAAVVTVVAVMGGVGVIPTDQADAGSVPKSARMESSAVDLAKVGSRSAKVSEGLGIEPEVVAAALRSDIRLPKKSGSGARIVFSESRQRVWLVDPQGADAGRDGVIRTYPVSGSVEDNLDPGTYAVFSRSRHAIGIDDSGTMEYFVRFTRGPSGAAIGFHTIPVDEGAPVQTIAQLGTPLSHGCIRQERSDAVALWDFAAEGTTVVVTG